MGRIMNSLMPSCSRWRYAAWVVLALTQGATPAGAFAEVITVSADDSPRLQRVVDRLVPGDTLRMQPGVYRATIDLRHLAGKGRPGERVTIEATAPGVVIKGSDVVTGWTRTDDGRWQVENWRIPSQQVFVNGTALRQVGGVLFRGYPTDPDNEFSKLRVGSSGIWPGRRDGTQSAMRTGSFYHDPIQHRLVIDPGPIDPRSAVVEVSVRTFGIVSEAVSGVMLKGLTVSHSNTSAVTRGGAVTLRGPGIVIDSVAVLECDSIGIVVDGPGFVIRNSTVDACGQLGMNVRGADGVLENNVVRNNNTRGFNKWWEAGGMKFVGNGGLKRSQVRGNVAVGNRGDGLWFDWGNSDNLVEQNVAAFNDGFGIHYEAGGPAKIRNNTSIANRQRGIYALHSHELEISGNTVAFNQLDGIVVMDEGLRDPSRVLDLRPRLNRVEGNVVAFNTGMALVLPNERSSNTSNGNCYIDKPSSPPRFSLGWPRAGGIGVKTLPQWIAATGQDEQSGVRLEVPSAAALGAIAAQDHAFDWRGALGAFSPPGQALQPSCGDVPRTH
jgi:hypothetical protein